jgi:hypothetical protein
VSLIDKCHWRPLGFGLPSVPIRCRVVMCWVLFPHEFGRGSPMTEKTSLVTQDILDGNGGGGSEKVRNRIALSSPSAATIALP